MGLARRYNKGKTAFQLIPLKSLKELADSFEFKVGDADVERIDA